MNHFIKINFILLLALSYIHAETTYISKIDQNKFITENKEIIETFGCFTTIVGDEEVIIDNDKIVFISDGEICDIASRSNPVIKQITYHLNSTTVMTTETFKKREEKKILNTINKLKKEYPKFDINKIISKLKEINPNNDNKYISPLGLELIWLKYFYKK